MAEDGGREGISKEDVRVERVGGDADVEPGLDGSTALHGNRHHSRVVGYVGGDARWFFNGSAEAISIPGSKILMPLRSASVMIQTRVRPSRSTVSREQP